MTIRWSGRHSILEWSRLSQGRKEGWRNLSVTIVFLAAIAGLSMIGHVLRSSERTMFLMMIGRQLSKIATDIDSII